MPEADRGTRRHLLDAATRLFAERGFEKVTVREICGEAGANLAAVNYYFRDKLGLYHEVLLLALARQRQQAAGLGAGTAPGTSAEDQLRAHIRVSLHRLLGQGGDARLHRLLAREIADPTHALEPIVERAMRPSADHLRRVISELIGCQADDARVVRSAASVQALCVMMRSHATASGLRSKRAPTAADIDVLARHIAEFSLAGIRAVGSGAAADSRPGRAPARWRAPSPGRGRTPPGDRVRHR